LGPRIIGTPDFRNKAASTVVTRSCTTGCKRCSWFFVLRWGGSASCLVLRASLPPSPPNENGFDVHAFAVGRRLQRHPLRHDGANPVLPHLVETRPRPQPIRQPPRFRFLFTHGKLLSSSATRKPSPRNTSRRGLVKSPESHQARRTPLTVTGEISKPPGPISSYEICGLCPSVPTLRGPMPRLC
jgi:hypothetical protein